jgi:hypothetical protein
MRLYLVTVMYSCIHGKFSIDNMHATTIGRVRKYRQRTEEFFKSTCIASSNIESDEHFVSFGFE